MSSKPQFQQNENGHVSKCKQYLRNHLTKLILYSAVERVRIHYKTQIDIDYTGFKGLRLYEGLKSTPNERIPANQKLSFSIRVQLATCFLDERQTLLALPSYKDAHLSRYILACKMGCAPVLTIQLMVDNGGASHTIKFTCKPSRYQ